MLSTVKAGISNLIFQFIKLPEWNCAVCVCEAAYSLTKQARIYDEWLKCIVTGLHLLKCCDLCVPVAFCHYKQNQLVGLDSSMCE